VDVRKQAVIAIALRAECAIAFDIDDAHHRPMAVRCSSASSARLVRTLAYI